MGKGCAGRTVARAGPRGRSAAGRRRHRRLSRAGGSAMSDRVDALEFKVAHLERALQELSDVMYRQQRELDALRDRNQRLVEQVQQLEDRGGDPNGVEIPPHY